MPIPITYETPEYVGNETLKTFADTDSLGKAYLDLHGKVSSGSIELLPEEMRKDPAISVFKTVPELAKGYVETKKMVGAIEKAPEKPDGYKFSPVNNVHPGLKADGIQNAFRGIFHKAGIGTKAADAIQQEVLGVLSSGMTQAETQRKEIAQKAETELRQSWGGDYDKKVDGIINVLNKAGGVLEADLDTVSKAMKGSPTLIRALGKIVGLLSEDSIGSLGANADTQISTKEAAAAEIAKLNAEIIKEGTKHPYYDAKHPDHAKFNENFQKLFQLAHS